MQFAQLLLTDSRRSADQQVLPALRLGESDDVANLIDASHQRHHAIDAEVDAPQRSPARLQETALVADLGTQGAEPVVDDLRAVGGEKDQVSAFRAGPGDDLR